jgi:hypothetical protein
MKGFHHNFELQVCACPKITRLVDFAKAPRKAARDL